MLKPKAQPRRKMNNWHIGKKCELVTEKPHHSFPGQVGEKARYKSRYFHGTKSGYNEYNIEIVTKKDGAIFFSNVDDDGFIYLYPEQVKHLKKILKSVT
jgi:hypothetical protein